MKFYKIKRPNQSSSIIINLDLVETVNINTKSNTAQINLASNKEVILTHKELSDFLNMLSVYNDQITQQLLSYITEE